jgi:hypothetical protein
VGGECASQYTTRPIIISKLLAIAAVLLLGDFPRALGGHFSHI